MTLLTRLLLSAALVAAACLPARVHASCTHKDFSLNFQLVRYTPPPPTPDGYPEEPGFPIGSACANTPDALYNLINENSFQNLVPDYNSMYFGAQANINFGGLPINVGIAPGSWDMDNTFELTIPDLNIKQVFNGENRDVSAQKMVDYIKHNKAIWDWIINNQITDTPESPIVDMIQGVNHILDPIILDGPVGETPSILTASYGHASVGGKKVDITTLPLSHSWHSSSDQGRKFTLSGAITQVKQVGSTTYQGSLGVSYRLPVTKQWALTPSLNYAISHSGVLDTATGLVSAGLSSTYRIPFNKLDLVIGNMVIYHQTTEAIATKGSIDPDITSWSIRNGAMLAQPVRLFGMPLSLEYSAVDTRYVGGTKFYVDNTQEIGISIGTNKRGDVSKNLTRVGLRYLHGRETHSFSVTGGYWF
jgi:hypothetical protein